MRISRPAPIAVVSSTAGWLPDKVFGEFRERCDHQTSVEIASGRGQTQSHRINIRERRGLHSVQGSMSDQNPFTEFLMAPIPNDHLCRYNPSILQIHGLKDDLGQVSRLGITRVRICIQYGFVRVLNLQP